eukprot:500646_1
MQAKDTDEMVINEGGDFEVQIHIQQLILRYSSIAKDLGVSSDPVVTVTIMEQQKSTKKINKQLNVTLDQILCFSLKALKPQQLLKTKCIIQVFDHNNNIIGSFEFDLGFVYYQKYHGIYNQCIALTKTEQQYIEKHDEEYKQDITTDGIQGFLTLSIIVLSANDEPINHEEMEQQVRVDQILLPSSITQVLCTLTVKIYAYKDLPELYKNEPNKQDTKLKMSPTEFINYFKDVVPDIIPQETIANEEKKQKHKKRFRPFFVVQFGETRVQSNNYDFEQCVGTSNDKVFVKFEIPIMEPTVGDEIKIEFWHKDSNNLISIIRENYYVIKQENYINKPRWYYMYGAPIGHDKNKYGKDMNNGCIDGTYFRGQSLIEMYITQQKQKPKPSPLFDTFEAKEEVALNTFETINDEINIICDIYHGTEMYRVGKEMFIEIAIGRQYKQIAIVKSDIKICLGDANYKREIWNINKKLQLTISG